ncbi:hypothetical protein KML24007_12950 [Alistipes indistinctus]
MYAKFPFKSYAAAGSCHGGSVYRPTAEAFEVFPVGVSPGLSGQSGWAALSGSLFPEHLQR